MGIDYSLYPFPSPPIIFLESPVRRFTLLPLFKIYEIREVAVSKKAPSAPRCAAIVGPYLSGKTTLLEALLDKAGAIGRKGSAKEGNTVGDASAEARARGMSTEMNIATCDYLGDQWTLIDCPGSVELGQEALCALTVVDTAIIVCDPEPEKAVALSPVLKFLDDRNIPHVIFVNKMDGANTRMREALEALQAVSERPLVLREVPIRDGDNITGFVDLVSERAFQWQDGKPSELIQLPEAVQEREQEARQEMLESIADFNDDLLEKLLEDIVPDPDEIYANLTKDLQQDLIVPVFFGSAEADYGITRLWKVLRHESPEPDATMDRLGVGSGGAQVQVFKNLHAAHTGKLSFGRVWSGDVTDGMTLGGGRVSGLFHMLGQKQDKAAKAGKGAVVALGRMEEVKAGTMLTEEGANPLDDWPEALSPLYSLSIHAEERSDEVKLSGALTKVLEEDPSLSSETSKDTGELLLWGQGEVHLRIALDRLKNRFNLGVAYEKPQTPYKETIRKPTKHHARHKKQSGGHGEFGDVHLEVKPLPRGSGFEFTDSITGGVVPKQYIPAVEHGVKEYLTFGPLGFPVVDVAVNLFDGQFHTVDSSDMAFRKAAILCMKEAMQNCSPVLLEPIMQVTVSVPNDFTSNVQRIVSGRRGQIQGFDAKEGWKGWDEVSAQMPQSEIGDLIIELRSATQGVGTFEWTFDHLQEFSGKEADQVVAAKKAEKG